ncbi:MAG: hypothetical protein PHY76_02570 [Patescibacteria group bacterium]|nr:hypothetical protein [Patescibacteria group bacterium]
MSNHFFSLFLLAVIMMPVLPLKASLLTTTNLITSSAPNENNFNPARILEDSDMLDINSLSLAEIQAFLESKNSFLATFKTTNAYGTPNKSVAEIIYDAANNNYDCKDVSLSENPTEAERQSKCRLITTISPKVILATIQKESSLIETTAYNARVDGWALGYGCPDGGSCNPYYKGLGKQINSAALQFLAYMKEPQHYPYKAGQTYTFTNPYGTISKEPMTVTVETQATASLYNYTPHVYNGNYNFYRLFKAYFPPGIRNYPNGSLLQISGEPGVWLIQNGVKRPFTNYSALTSRFDPKKIIIVSSAALTPYTKGEPIRFANYSLIQVESGGIYLLVDNEKRPIDSMTTFKAIGFNQEELIAATENDLASYALGKTITTASAYPTGHLIQNPVNGGVYFVESGYKYPIPDRVFLETKFKGRKVTRGTVEELEKYETGAAVSFDDGELIKSDSVNTVYLISEGRKRPFLTGETFEALGYKFSNVITVSPQHLASYPLGDPVLIQNTPTN